MDTKQPEALRLAPCPFCGGGARRTTVGTNAWFGTGCDGDQSCPAHLRALTHKTQAEADAAWNRRAPAPASSEPVAVHTDPEGYQDGAWYWVKINGFGGNSIMAPAMYRANCGAWYSHEFIGISTRFLDVLGPCTLASDIYTAAQVQAMGRVPPGWQAVLVEPTKEMKVAAVKFANGPAVYKAVATAALEIEEEICAEAYEAMLAAAPQPPAPSGPALEPVDKSPNLQCQAVDKSPETQGCGPAREPLTPEQLVTCMQLAGFTTWDSRMWELKRQIEAALGITAAQKGDAPK